MDNFEEQFKRMESTPTEILTEVSEQLPPVDHTQLKIETDILDGIGDHTKSNDNKANDNVQDKDEVPPNNGTKLGDLVNGDIAINVFEIILPPLMVLIIKKVKNKDVLREVFLLNDTERKQLSPVLDNFLKHINLDFSNPVTAFIVTVVLIYGVKGVDAINDTTPHKTTRRKKAEADATDLPYEDEPVKQKRKAHKDGCMCVVCIQRRANHGR